MLNLLPFYNNYQKIFISEKLHSTLENSQKSKGTLAINRKKRPEMGEKSSQEEVVGKGVISRPLSTKQNQVEKIQNVITDLTRITKEAAKIRKNAKELVEVRNSTQHSARPRAL